MFVKYISTYFISLLAIILLDGCWLSIMGKSFYQKHLFHLFNDQFNITPALFFYPLYTLGIVVFSIYNKPMINQSLLEVTLRAALLGLCSYGAYDFTNQATLKDWPLIVTIVDLAWGIFVTSAAAIAGYLFTFYRF